MRRKGPLAIILLLCVLILLACTCSNPITTYFSTQTALMETATATMWTPTPTFTPTNTPTNTPTFTPTFTPTPEYLFMDDFEDPDSGWDEENDSLVLFEYSDGGYRMKLKDANYFVWAFAPTDRGYSDFRVEVDATKIGGPDETEFGIIARYQDHDNFYVFLVTNDGEGLIFKFEDGSYEGLSNDVLEDIDGVNPDELNHIAVVCQGNDLELYVNGDLVLSASDSALGSGDIGLVVGNLDVPGADVLFDNFYIYPV